MLSELFTPSTELVRGAYIELSSLSWYGNISHEDARMQFDRWLTEHDRQIAERAWNEGFDSGFYDGQVHPTNDACETVIQNPYRKEQ